MNFSINTEPWMDSAACIGHDPELWYAENIQGRNGGDSEATQQARAICYDCPSRLACLDWAMANETTWGRWGIWGGLNPNERRALDQAAS